MNEPATGERPRVPIRTSGLLRSSLVFSGLTLVSRVMGFARDVVITSKLGASATPAADAFYTALAFPNLFRRIFGEGAFAAAFVPAYSRTLEAEGPAEADRVAVDALAAVAAATLAITVACQLAMPWLMYLINPGYADDPVKFKLAVILTQITMPYLPAMAITALLSGVTNAHGRFALSALAPTLLNLFMLVAVWPQPDDRSAAFAASWAVAGAGLAQAALLWWGVRRLGARVRPRAPRLTPEIRALIGKSVPGAIAAGATQINVFVAGALVSQIDGARSWLNVADRLYQLPLGLFGVAIGVALLPRLSRALQAGDAGGARNSMDQAMIFALALTLPAAAALTAIPFFLIDGLFTRGAFLEVDARATANALFHYGWGVPAFVLARVLSPAFFARLDTRGPMVFALISVAVNLALGLLLVPLIGFVGVAIATSTAAWLNVAQMAGALWRRRDYRPSPLAAARMARILAAAAALGGLLALVAANRDAVERAASALALGPLGAKEIAVLLTCLAGAIVYIALLFAVRGLRLSEVRTAMRGERGPKGADLAAGPDPG